MPIGQRNIQQIQLYSTNDTNIPPCTCLMSFEIEKFNYTYMTDTIMRLMFISV